jgi:hypothetical protein
MGKLDTIKKGLVSLHLIWLADKAFTLAAAGKDMAALEIISEAIRKKGTLVQYKFGIELVLLQIFLKECHFGVSYEEYDWKNLRNAIARANEYNNSEKLHLLIYLDELAGVAGADVLRDTKHIDRSEGEKVSPRLIRRFPNCRSIATNLVFRGTAPSKGHVQYTGTAPKQRTSNLMFREVRFSSGRIADAS